ncbi:MAG: magnesium/cobalt transporter CorA [Candidatus Heimdallarchaeota archaeon]|nr:magnesium/cobalt transporter CorA [Candidatus Heimdallarchaeota archaeon]
MRNFQSATDQSEEKQEEKCTSSEPKISFLCYNNQTFETKELTDLSNLNKTIQSDCVNWIDIIGHPSVEMLNNFGEFFDIHPLVLEDIQSTNQRLKIDYYSNYLYIIIKAINYEEEKGGVIEQVSIILGKNFIISFQELAPNQFDQIKAKIKIDKKRIRKRGTDYLLYLLLDILIDNYFINLERIGDQLEELEDELITNPNPETLQVIYQLKREILLLRKSIWPMREAINDLSKTGINLIKEPTKIYFRDIYDHVFQVIDTLETYREILSGMIDVFLSSISNKMNEIMKILTIIATIFIPLTFIVGIYGMNFHFMPELAWKWSYPIVIAIMAAIATTMLIYFKKKKWF